MSGVVKHFISVIVPVYRVEKYIRKCIESILSQSFKNFELILIDDGTTDNSGRICDEYGKLNNNIIVIHKENGGLSDARNAGIKIARGQFITFIDSDDYISLDYLKILYDVQRKTNADIVQALYTRKMKFASQDEEIVEFTSQEAIKELLTWGMIEVYAWAKLYKRSLFEDIEYPIGYINEDAFTTYKLIANANKVCVIKKEIYYYRITPDSIMNQHFNKKRFQILEVFDNMANFFCCRGMSYNDELEYYKMRVEINLYNECIKDEKSADEFDYELTEIRKNMMNYNVNNKYTDGKYRILILILSSFPKLYRFFVKCSK